MQKVFKILKIILHPNKSLLLNIFIWYNNDQHDWVKPQIA